MRTCYAGLISHIVCIARPSVGWYSAVWYSLLVCFGTLSLFWFGLVLSPSFGLELSLLVWYSGLVISGPWCHAFHDIRLVDGILIFDWYMI